MTWPAKDRSKELAAIKRFDEGKTMSLSEEDRALTYEEAMQERAYLAGMMAGWNFGIVEDKDSYMRAVEARDGYLKPILAAREEGRQQASERLEELEAAVKAAWGQFRFYATQHARKNTPDGDAKAATNLEWAERMEAALQGADNGR